MLTSLTILRARIRFAVRQIAVASGAGALVLAGLTLLGAAGVVWLSARYGVLIALCAAGGALILLGVLVFLVARPRPAAAVAEAAPAAEAAAQTAVLPGGEMIATASRALRTAQAALPPGSGAAITGAVTAQVARRPVQAVAAAVAVGAVLGFVRHARRPVSNGVGAAGLAPGTAGVASATPPPVAPAARGAQPQTRR